MAGRAIQFLKQHQALQLLIQPAGFKSRQHDSPVGSRAEKKHGNHQSRPILGSRPSFR